MLEIFDRWSFQRFSTDGSSKVTFGHLKRWLMGRMQGASWRLEHLILLLYSCLFSQVKWLCATWTRSWSITLTLGEVMKRHFDLVFKNVKPKIWIYNKRFVVEKHKSWITRQQFLLLYTFTKKLAHSCSIWIWFFIYMKYEFDFLYMWNMNLICIFS